MEKGAGACSRSKTGESKGGKAGQAVDSSFLLKMFCRKPVGAEVSKSILVAASLAAGLALTACSSRYANLPGAYKGRPFEDHHYMGGPQVIPGRVQAAYFDLGGEGIAYHDTDKVKSSCSRCITTKATT